MHLHKVAKHNKQMKGLSEQVTRTRTTLCKLHEKWCNACLESMYSGG